MKKFIVYVLDTVNLFVLVNIVKHTDIQFQPFKITSDNWKIVIIAVVFVILIGILSVSIRESEYDAGYEDGYEDGISDDE